MIDSVALRAHYRAFLRDDRILLTGHSHQAWPDVAREGMLEAFDDAALHVDDKWARAFEAARAVREAVASDLGADSEEIALGASTHELLVRLASSFELTRRPRLVTTSGEFHTLHRQLGRLREAGLELTTVDVGEVGTLAQRLADALDPRTSAVFVSSVLFETSARVPGLAALAERARSLGVAMVVDAYHAYRVVPFDCASLGGDVFVVGGGYKYAQWGEGNCFLRVPSSYERTPIVTGWFADFAGLAAPRDGRAIGYGSRPYERFAGSTYDPTSHYRARRVIRFFREQGLGLEALRATSLRQTARLLEGFEGLDVRTPTTDGRGGFVAVAVPDAGALVRGLRERGIWIDARGNLARFGPSPLTSDDELDRAIRATRACLGSKLADEEGCAPRRR